MIRHAEKAQALREIGNITWLRLQDIEPMKGLTTHVWTSSSGTGAAGMHVDVYAPGSRKLHRHFG